MTDIEIHTRHFKAHIFFLYGTKKEFRIPENYFDFISLQKYKFTFLGYETIFGYANGMVYYTKAEKMAPTVPNRCRCEVPDGIEWATVNKKIEKYAITGRI